MVDIWRNGVQEKGVRDMKGMKKIFVILMSALIIAQTGMLSVCAKSAEGEKKTIVISDIDTKQLNGEVGKSSTEIKTQGLRSADIKIVREDWTRIRELVISRRNISIKDGKYSYRLVLRSNRTLTFDNDLEIYYQGVNGRYKLHYDIDKTDNHTMIVTGVFDNVIIASPLLEKLSEADRNWILAHVSKDSYFYQLFLKTKEGFTLTNALRFMFDSHKLGYSIKYAYDLLTDKQTLIITDISDCAQNGTNAGSSGGTAVRPADPEPAAPAVRPAVQKADNTLSVKGRTASVSYSKLRLKAQTLDITDVVFFDDIGQGRLSFVRVSGNSKITVNGKTGDVTIEKGLSKGSYSVTVDVAAAGDAKTGASAAKRVTFTVKVK